MIVRDFGYPKDSDSFAGSLQKDWTSMDPLNVRVINIINSFPLQLKIHVANKDHDPANDHELSVQKDEVLLELENERYALTEDLEIDPPLPEFIQQVNQFAQFVSPGWILCIKLCIGPARVELVDLGIVPTSIVT
jgi:hypothetical protein